VAARAARPEIAARNESPALGEDDRRMLRELGYEAD